MEPFGAAASAIAVIGLSVKVVKAITSATGATQDRRRLREEVRALESILQQLSDEAEDSEEGEAWRQTLEALEAPDAPLGRLELILIEVLAKLQPETGRRKAIASLAWPFKEKQVTEMLAAIEREKGLLQIALENNNRRLLQEIKAAATGNTKQLAVVIDALSASAAQTTARLEVLQDGQADLAINEQRQKTLKWLSLIEYTVQQSDFLRRRQPGTGKWLLESPEYKAWAYGEKGTLFCPGIPGAGKTILTSVVVENLLDMAQHQRPIGVAFVYCDFNRHVDQQVEDLLGSVARQLAGQADPLPRALQEIHQTYGERGPPSSKVLSEALVAILPAFARVFVVIDALDECQLTSRTKFLSQILQIQTEHDINLFVTSRLIPQISAYFKECPSLEIRAHETDVRLYLDGQISDLPSFVQNSPQLQEEIRNSIVNVTDGMFLLAQLHIRSLVGKRSPKAVKSALARLPQGSDAYDSAYNEAMLRIEGQPADQAALAKETLAWITRATKLLTASELQHALAVEADELEFDKDNISGIEDILSACAGLVTLVQESNVIRLVHYTTQEYFDRSWAQWFATADTQLATTCVAYLSFSKFRNPNEKYSELTTVENVLYAYAALNWGHHARDIRQPWPRLVDFLTSSPAVNGAIICLFHKQLGLHPQSPDGCPDVFNALHLVSIHGLVELARHLPGCLTEIDSEDSWNRTPLVYAAYHGRVNMVRWLLEHGADPNKRDIHGRSAIFFAAEQAHLSALEPLLGTGTADPDVADLYGQTPPSVAAQRGHLDVLTFLLNTGKVDIGSKNDRGETPLLLASRSGHADVVQAILGSGRADANFNNGHVELAPLIVATKHDHLQVVKALLDCEAIEISPMALWFAAANGNEAITRMLIETGKTDVNVKNQNGLTALTANIAGNLCSLPVVNVLLAAEGIDPDIGDPNGRSSLSWAAGIDHRDHELFPNIMRSILRTGKADVNSRDFKGQTPLFHAALHHRPPSVTILLAVDGIERDSVDHQGVSPLLALAGAPSHYYSADSVSAAIGRFMLGGGGINVNRTDNEGWTPLTAALATGKRDLAHALLECPGIEIDTPKAGTEHRGRTPLSFAASGNDMVDVVRELLAMGANANARDDRGRSALCWVASRTPFSDSISASKISMLLQGGADVDSRDNSGRTPLSYAVRHGHVGGIRTFVEHGADINSRDTLGKTPLIYVGRWSKPEAVKIMVELGADVQARDTRGMTALMKAAWIEWQNGPEIVKILLEAGARVDERDDDGCTAIWYACGEHQDRRYTKENARSLLAHGADIDLEDNDSQTVLSWAQEAGRHWVVSLLQEHCLTRDEARPVETAELSIRLAAAQTVNRRPDAAGGRELLSEINQLPA